MTSKPTELGSPWYQNFWPWFIVILLGLSVAGSLTSVAIAYRYRDIDVRVTVPAEGSTPSDRGLREDGR